MKSGHILFKQDIVIILASALFFILPVLLMTRGQILRLDTDYDANLPIYSYVFDSFRTSGIIPATNPYIGAGLPVFGDPLSALYNPLFSVTLYIFGVDYGMRLLLVLLAAQSALTQWLFLKSLRISRAVCLWGAILYMVSGAFAAKVNAGHIEKMLSYPLLPLFFLYVMRRQLNYRIAAGSALVLTLIFFSGDIYGVWLLTVLFVALTIYRIFTGESLRQVIFFITVFVFFGIFSLPKLIPVLQGYPMLVRFFPIDPYAGSIHAWLVPVTFLLPWQVSFYDRPLFQRLLGFHFNWYEYYAFLSPVVLVFLMKAGRIMRRKESKVILLLIITGCLYVALGFPYSPFHWLFAFLHKETVRVPQRMIMVMTPLVVSFLGLCVHHMTRNPKGKGLVLWAGVVSLLWTAAVSQQTLIGTFEPPRTRQQQVAQELRKRENGEFAVVTFTCCMQSFLIDERIRVLNYYYGWRTDKTPYFYTKDGSVDHMAIRMHRPKYIIGGREDSFDHDGYVPYLIIDDILVWKSIVSELSVNL